MPKPDATRKSGYYWIRSTDERPNWPTPSWVPAEWNADSKVWFLIGVRGPVALDNVRVDERSITRSPLPTRAIAHQVLPVSVIELWKFPRIALQSVLNRMRIELHADREKKTRVITRVSMNTKCELMITMEDDLGQYDHLREGDAE